MSVLQMPKIMMISKWIRGQRRSEMELVIKGDMTDMIDFRIETDSSTEGRSKGENFYNSIKSQNRPPIKEENSAGGYTGGYHRAQKDRNRAAVAHHNRKELSTKKFAKGFGANPAR